MKKPRILVWDLENSPGLGYFWGQTWKTSIIRVVEPSRVMCFAAKWRGDRQIQFRSTFHDGLDDMLETCRDLLDEADAVVSYNGARHDTPHITTEFMRDEFRDRGLSQPSPFKEIDLYKVTKGKLKLHSNRLAYAGNEFGIGDKVAHEGFDLWLKCMAGDEKAWGRMKRYNIGDVRLTDRYYDRLLPIIPPSMHPNFNLYTNGDVCPKCGSADLRREGYAHTALSRFQRYQCRACDTWCQEGKSIARANMRGSA